MAAPFSRVVSGSEQPKNTIANRTIEIAEIPLFISFLLLIMTPLLAIPAITDADR
jgi:hypothetical protein